MPTTIHVASRKGLLAIDGDSGALTDIAFRGDPVSAVLDDGRDGTLYAALNLGHFGVKLHRRAKGGDWEEVAVPAFAKTEAGDGESLHMIWTLVAGGPDQPGRLWAGCLPAGLFRSNDRGETWTLTDSLWDRPERKEWFGGGYDMAGIHSILIDPRDSRAITLGISCGGVWRSADDGASWRLAGKGMAADFMPPERSGDPNIQDVHRLSACAAHPDVIWCQHHCATYRSTDGGEQWSLLDPPGTGFGFAVIAHPSDPDIAWFAPAEKDQRRLPVDQRFVVHRAEDGGRAWQAQDQGLPATPAFDLVYRHAMDIAPDGQHIAMGSTTGSLWLTRDGGARWQLLSAHLPPIAQVAFAAG